MNNTHNGFYIWKTKKGYDYGKNGTSHHYSKTSYNEVIKHINSIKISKWD